MTENYWDKVAEKFSSIYDYESIIDLLFRQGVALRAEKTLSLVNEGDTVLDLGCGPGHQLVEAINRGASLAVGVDSSPRMIELARENARKAGVEDKIELHVADIYEYSDDRKFDVVWALGVFDYQRDPVGLLTRMKEFSRHFIAASFRRRWVLRYPIRKLVYRFRGQYVSYYSKFELQRLFEKAGLPNPIIDQVTRADWLVIATVK